MKKCLCLVRSVAFETVLKLAVIVSTVAMLDPDATNVNARRTTPWARVWLVVDQTCTTLFLVEAIARSSRTASRSRRGPSRRAPRQGAALRALMLTRKTHETAGARSSGRSVPVHGRRGRGVVDRVADVWFARTAF